MYILQLLAVTFLLQATLTAAVTRTNCDEFSKDATFNETLATKGRSWLLLHCWAKGTNNQNGCGERRCLEFHAVSQKEQKELSDLWNKKMPNTNWTLVTIKMKIPCTEASNHTHDYYLEQLGPNGFYKTLQITPTGNSDVDIHRSSVRIKIVESEYLAMMDCIERMTFVLGKEPLKPKEHPEIEKMLNIFEQDP